MEFGIALQQKYGEDGLHKSDVMDLFDMLNSPIAYPIELSAREHESSAMGFITPNAATILEFDYEASGLHDFIANILDSDEEPDNCIYEFKGIKIWVG